MSQTTYSFCLWETNGRTSKADQTMLFHSIFGGKTSVLNVWSEVDKTTEWSEKAPKVKQIQFDEIGAFYSILRG